MDSPLMRRDRKRNSNNTERRGSMLTDWTKFRTMGKFLTTSQFQQKNPEKLWALEIATMWHDVSDNGQHCLIRRNHGIGPEQNTSFSALHVMTRVNTKHTPARSRKVIKWKLDVQQKIHYEGCVTHSGPFFPSTSDKASLAAIISAMSPIFLNHQWKHRSQWTCIVCKCKAFHWNNYNNWWWEILLFCFFWHRSLRSSTRTSTHGLVAAPPLKRLHVLIIPLPSGRG